MESEFGIEPDRLISAFGHLSDAQLMQSPEKSMDAYLSQLNLADGEMPRAEELYSKLLVDMRMQKIGKQDNTNLIPVELQSAMSEMQTLQKPVALDKAGIEGMNEKFFNVYPNHFGRPLQASNPEQGNLAQAGFMPNAEGQFVPDATQAMNPDEAALSQDSQNPVDTADALWAQRIGQKAAEKEESGNLLGLATAGAAGAGAISEMDAPDAEVPEWLSKLNEVNVEPEAEAKITAKADDSSNFDDGNSQGSSEGNSSLLNPEGTATKSGADKFAKVLATGTAANSASSQSESEGVESIVKNVQLLKNRGGGEMKVQLNQEGLGDVQLKVAVNEGKVNIQMLTENKDAKKLLESDLGALKVELGDKKIDLSEIKVDVAKDLKNSLEQQLQDQRREETRQFWQQFKEENDAKRAMAVNMGLNSYTKKDPDSINDRTEQAARYRSSNLDTRLNIVA
jgi:flagellar hook-length control protein FliK